MYWSFSFLVVSLFVEILPAITRLVFSHQILSWFGDSSLQLHPFSLHRIMEEATSHGYQVGDWFGPSQVAMLLR